MCKSGSSRWRCAPWLFMIGAQCQLAAAGESDLISAFSALEGHVTGVSPLSEAQIASHKLTIDANRDLFGNSSSAIGASFNLVSAYEANIGPMWSAGSPTQNGYSRRDTSDGDINWAMFHVMQYIVDDTYNAGNIQTHASLLDGYKFQSADVFPGYAVAPAAPGARHRVSIDASFLDTFGRDTMHWADRPARNATGTFLAPGSIATIHVPQSMVNQGYQVRVGAHSWDLSNKNPVDRLDRVSLVYDIDSTSVQIASPLGGNIYIESPFGADAGVVDVEIQGAVRSPFFSAQDHHTTSLSDWQTTERNFAAPWTDFQSEKFMMQVPTGWVYALDDPATLMNNWDKAIDVTNDLMGFDRDRGKTTLYDQVDVRIRAGAYAPGYPSVNNTYDPLRNNDASGYNTAGNAYTGTTGNYLVRGPQYAPDYEFHELGHAYLFPKLPGETESVVNLLHVAVFNQAFDYDLNYAFRTSMRGHNDFHTLDNTAVTWMTSFNFFVRDRPMDKLEKQYQLKGHAKFVEVARLFGWQTLGDYYRSYNTVDDQNGGRYNTGIDGHLLALSSAAGKDITPLFHFWGIHPDNPGGLKADLNARGLGKSREIYELLHHYRTLVPEDNAAFRAFATNWWGGQPQITGYWTESEHARQWDEQDLSGSNPELPNGEMYTEASAELIRSRIQALLTEYFLDMLADLNQDDSLDVQDWSIFIEHAGTDMSGLTPGQALLRGDLDGDMDNDIHDFALFRSGYEMVHTEPGAFEAMLANVPEPGTGLFLLSGVLMIWTRVRPD